MIRISVFKDEEQLLSQEFKKSEILFGREREADVQLVAGAVSRRHARLAKVNGRWQIADLGAANGVYVSQGDAKPERVVIHYLEPDDRIHIEAFVITLSKLDGETEPDVAGFENLQDEVSFETKRTQFISMHDVLNGPGGEELKKLGVQVASRKEPTSPPGGPEEATTLPPTSTQEMWEAQMNSPDGHSRRFSLRGDQIVVGSSPECDIVLPTGPAKIALLCRDGATVTVTRTGRWPFPRITVDGRVIKEAFLNHKDAFFVGKFEVCLFLKQPFN